MKKPAPVKIIIPYTPKILPVMGYGQPILRETCVNAEPGQETSELVVNLQATLHATRTGAAMAAPQVGSNLNIFVTNSFGASKVFINPTIVKRDLKGAHWNEGCLSMPGVWANTGIRDGLLKVEYYDENFMKVSAKLRGFSAIVFQHEYDHLQGILFTDHLTKEGREKIKHDLSALENNHPPATIYDMIFPKQPV